MHSLVHPTSDGTSSLGIDPEAAFASVLPPEHAGAVRSAGRSHTKTSWQRHLDSIRSESHFQDLYTQERQENREEMRGMRDEISGLREENRMLQGQLSEVLALLKANSTCSNQFWNQSQHHDDDGPDDPPATAV